MQRIIQKEQEVDMIKIVWSINDINKYQTGSLPDDAVKIETPQSVGDLMKKAVPIAAILCVFLFIAMLCKTIICKTVVISPIFILVGFTFGFLLLIIHEWLHGIVYPKGADVTIVAGCGIHTETGEPARHNGIHRFFLEKNSHVLYLEKHVGTGFIKAKRSIDPVTEAWLADGALLEMETSQLGGVQTALRNTKATLEGASSLVIREHLLTDSDETLTTNFDVVLNGDGSSVNLVSRSVARGESYQEYHSNIVGNAKCSGHSECDAIITDHGKVTAQPALTAANEDAALIHEAAIGKIAGEQILKLRTLGLTESEAEAAIINGFLK